MSNGNAVRGYIAELRRTIEAVNASNNPAFGFTGTRLAEAPPSLERATAWQLGERGKNGDGAAGGGTASLGVCGSAGGGCMLANEALAALRLSDGDPASRIAIARFFAENIAVQASGLERAVTEGAESVNGADAALGG
jgi:hypothetical protein